MASGSSKGPQTVRWNKDIIEHAVPDGHVCEGDVCGQSAAFTTKRGRVDLSNRTLIHLACVVTSLMAHEAFVDPL